MPRSIHEPFEGVIADDARRSEPWWPSPPAPPPVTFKAIGPLYDDGLDWNAPFEDDRWELYDLGSDPTEVHDLAAERPDVLEDLVARWWEAARANDVLPLENRILHVILNERPHLPGPRLTATYYPATSPVPERVALDTKNRGHRLDADVEVPAGVDVAGVLLAQGSTLGGFSFHVRDGRLVYVHNVYGRRRLTVSADLPPLAGAHRLSYRYEPGAPGAGGVAVLEVDGEVVADATLPEVTVVAFNGTGTGLTCGYEFGPAVGEGYEAPFPFTPGALRRVVVTLSETPAINPMVEFERILFEQ